MNCDICGDPVVVDAEAVAEAAGTFSKEELADAVVWCETCWQKMRVQVPEFDARYGNARPDQ